MVTWSPDTAGKHGPLLPLLQDLDADRKPFIPRRNHLLKSNKTRKKRLSSLRDQGLETAKKAGYEVVSGELFSPEQKGIKQLLSNYFNARQQLDANELSDRAHAEIFVNSFRNNQQLIAEDLSEKNFNTGRITKYLSELVQLEYRKRAYVYAILDLANIGIATPEYALSNDPRSVDDGIIKFISFKKLQWQIEALKEDMKNQGQQWYQALGGNGPAPTAALLKYQNQIRKLEAQQSDLRITARKNAEALFPPKMFIWEPTDYQITPEKALVRPGIALREFSLPEGGSTLKHFSLLDLEGGKQHLGEPAEPHTVDDLAMSIKVAQKPGKDEALEKLLKDSGAKKYALKDDWFDIDGLFKPETFYLDIADRNALNRKDPEELESWGTYLRSFLFESEAKRHLLGFDDSYTGQFTRLVISGIPGDLGKTLENDLKVEVLTGADGPGSAVEASWSGGKPTAGYDFAEARIGTNLTYRQGQLDLISVKLPEPDNTEPVAMQYITEDGIGELELGRFYCELNLKCWGYVGARMLLSRSVGLEATPGEGIQVKGINRQNREVTGAEFDAFSGIQSGLLASAEMNWAIPERLRQSYKWQLINQTVPEWISLGSINGELTGSAGVGVQGDITIGLHNGRLILYAKGKIAAGIGAGYSLGFELAFDTLPLWIQLLQQELHDNGYRRVYWIDEDAFKYLGMLTNLFLSSALSISFLAAQTYDFVEEVYREFNSGRNAGIVAVSITEAIEIAEGTRVVADDRPRVSLDEYKSWFLGLQPEAIGPMLHNLVSEPVKFGSVDGEEPKTKDQMLKLQQISILQCLQWMSESERLRSESYRDTKPNRIQRQFEESIIRMNTQGVKQKGSTVLTARNNIARLDAFMGRERSNLYETQELMTYKALLNKLSLHIWS